MYELLFSNEFDLWLRRLPDRQARVRITARLEKVRVGHFGDWAFVGAGLCELRVHVGPGYRLYYKQVGTKIYVFLCGGDKSSQPRDIAKALRMASDLGDR